MSWTTLWIPSARSAEPGPSTKPRGSIPRASTGTRSEDLQVAKWNLYHLNNLKGWFLVINLRWEKKATKMKSYNLAPSFHVWIFENWLGPLLNQAPIYWARSQLPGRPHWTLTQEITPRIIITIENGSE